MREHGQDTHPACLQHPVSGSQVVIGSHDVALGHIWGHSMRCDQRLKFALGLCGRCRLCCMCVCIQAGSSSCTAVAHTPIVFSKPGLDEGKPSRSSPLLLHAGDGANRSHASTCTAPSCAACAAFEK
jgi:hypothetical protein